MFMETIQFLLFENLFPFLLLGVHVRAMSVWGGVLVCTCMHNYIHMHEEDRGNLDYHSLEIVHLFFFNFGAGFLFGLKLTE